MSVRAGQWCRAKLKGAKPRALVVNSGNANAFTGKNGRQACQFTADIASKPWAASRRISSSTGVIGDR
jgi:glutamate N-acetyltransferase/amino-acid N-acetyltransferase